MIAYDTPDGLRIARHHRTIKESDSVSEAFLHADGVEFELPQGDVSIRGDDSQVGLVVQSKRSRKSVTVASNGSKKDVGGD